MLLTFEKDKTILAKPCESNDRKMKDRNIKDCVSSKNAHDEATIGRKYLSVLHFSVMTFFKS
jgi:hypothetical protein